jgi:hypothetical protein
MSLYDYRYSLYPNGDLIVTKEMRVENRHLLTEKERKKSRFFQLSYQKYRLLSSAAITLIKHAKNKPIFITFTFNEKLKISEVDANKIWNTFIKNFRKTYDCTNYVGVLEYTKAHCPHYHFIAEFPFKKITDINRSWVNCIDNFYNNIPRDFILGSARLPKDTPSVVDDPNGVVRYLCKYFTKGIGVKYRTKCYFISKELRVRSGSVRISNEKFELIETNLTAKKRYNFDHCSVFCFDQNEIDFFGTTFD